MYSWPCFLIASIKTNYSKNRAFCGVLRQKRQLFLYICRINWFSEVIDWLKRFFHLQLLTASSGKAVLHALARMQQLPWLKYYRITALKSVRRQQSLQATPSGKPL